MALDPNSADRAPESRPGVRIGAVVSRFHDELTGAMLRSAEAELRASGMEDDIHTVWAPGAFELPLIARRLARRKDIDAVLCFGLVLTGETTHDHWVSMGATQGITLASLETDKPILFGVLTCQTLEQARSRALSAD
ncbi:MAG: 6,7-dimethyl-8-ribityllumazine synthase, partial [Planctomycetota bacterium]